MKMKASDEDLKQYRWMMKKSEVAKRLRYCIQQGDLVNYCLLSIKLYRIGYSEEEIRSFLIAANEIPVDSISDNL